MPPKRKSNATEDGDLQQPRRRSSRRTTSGPKEDLPETSKPEPKTKAPKKSEQKKEPPLEPVQEKEPAENPKPADKATEKSSPVARPETNESSARQYWLMKAEPETRLERGHDVRFSIDDLAAKTEPEPWDGIRAYPARNNIRSMKKGDLAFFYHSNCKIPGIVGTMTIVQEHSPDLSAQDPKAPYYDPKDNKPDDPKWSVVHVTFKQKFKEMITLKELKEWQGTKGHPLENMQMLKLARLSVSKVSKGEWDFLVGEIEKRGDVVEQ